MGKNEAENNQVFLDYLNCKYEGDFIIVKCKKEFRGDKGNIYHVVCREKNYGDLFVMYCYPKKDDTTDNNIIEIGDVKYEVWDEYAMVVLQNEYAERIKNEIGEALMVKCYLVLDNAYISAEQFAKGLEYCMNNEEFNTHMRTYVVMKKEARIPEVREKIEKLLVSYEGYMQYLYIGYTDVWDTAILEKQYYDNYGEYSEYIVDSPMMDCVEFSFITRENGVEKQHIEKE